MMRNIYGFILCVFYLSGYAAAPLLSIIPVVKAPTQLANTSFTVAMYQVTNNTQTLHQFKMQPIQGVTQVTTTAGACSNPITLNSGQSCSLNLHISGNQMPPAIKGGPVVCNNSPNPFACSQPSISGSLNISLLVGDPMAENTWIKVLVSESEPPDDIATYVNKIIALAPNLTQMHLRVPAGPYNTNKYVQLINLFRTAYGPSIAMGFHPDNSSTSYSGWGCTDGDSVCVLNASIKAMNEINAIADTPGNPGFNIFTLEQGYVEIQPATPANLTAVKSCLNPAATPGVTCAPCSSCSPQTVIASPVVTFGNVSQSYGGPEIYGPTLLDYGYAQSYNLGKRIGPYADLMTSGYFPQYSTQCATYTVDLNVVDVDSSSAYAPEIPCLATGQTYPNVYTYPSQTSGIPPNVPVAAAYVGYLLTQSPPISNTIDTSGSTVYLTFSGEPEFLGSPGWTLANISDFYTTLYADFSSLQNTNPSLFPPGGTSPLNIQYGIWNFDDILANE